MNALFLEGVSFFNKGFYFEAHDVFEELWMDERGESKKFYQGLVQLATGYYHLSMGNLRGGSSQLNKALDKLEPFEPGLMSLELTELLVQVRACLEQLEKKTKDQFLFSDLKSYIPSLKLAKNDKRL